MKRLVFLLLVLSVLFTWSVSYAQADGPSAELQSIPTDGGMDWEYFSIGPDHYLAVANYRFHPVNSIIYKWNGTSFVEFQAIPTNGAVDWEYFMLGTDHYLAVANARDGDNHTINSKVYKWNGVNFVEYQSIPTSGSHDWKHFTIGTDHYLVSANYRDNISYNIDSKIYKWNGTNFVEFQALPTNGAHDWEYFTIGADHYLAVANVHNGSFDFNVNSKLYRWNGSSFVEFQSIPTIGGWTWEYFSIGSDHYLAIANFQDNTDYTTDSKIYKETIIWL